MKAKAFYVRRANGLGEIINAASVETVFRDLQLRSGWVRDYTTGYEVWVHNDGHRVTTSSFDWMKSGPRWLDVSHVNIEGVYIDTEPLLSAIRSDTMNANEQNENQWYTTISLPTDEDYQGISLTVNLNDAASVRVAIERLHELIDVLKRHTDAGVRAQ